jgi:hypothetical protein
VKTTGVSFACRHLRAFHWRARDLRQSPIHLKAVYIHVEVCVCVCVYGSYTIREDRPVDVCGCRMWLHEPALSASRSTTRERRCVIRFQVPFVGRAVRRQGRSVFNLPANLLLLASRGRYGEKEKSSSRQFAKLHPGSNEIFRYSPVGRQFGLASLAKSLTLLQDCDCGPYISVSAPAASPVNVL